MSASKKKRMGSQRRSLNPNAQESPQTGDKATSPPVPQGRQRADARADLSLSPSSEPLETPERKKKLGSQRANKGKRQIKDVTTESSHKPIEEEEGSPTHSRALDTLGIKNENIDESLFAESEAAGSELVLNAASNVSASTITEAVSKENDNQDTKPVSTSDLLLRVAQNKEYLTGFGSGEEGVSSEKDQAQQMPDIFGGTIPAGVTEESTSSVRLTEHEEIISSQDHYNKQISENKARPIEKPVSQESDKSHLPTAKPRKMGSSRRKNVINVKEMQDQGNDTEAKSNISDEMGATGLTSVEKTQEVHVSVSATEMTNKQEGDIEINLPPKVNVVQTNDFSDDISDNLSEAKEVDMGNVVNMEAQGDQTEESEGMNEQDLSESSSGEITPTTDTVVDAGITQILEKEQTSLQPVFDQSNDVNKDFTKKESITTTEFTAALEDTHPSDFSLDYFATANEKESEKDETSVGRSLAAELFSELEPNTFSAKEVTKEDNLYDEQLVQNEESFDLLPPKPQVIDNAARSSPPHDVEVEESSPQPVSDDSQQHQDEMKATAAATLVQETIIESDIYPSENKQNSDKSSVSKDMFESTSESIPSTINEIVEPVFGALQELKPPIEGVPLLDQNIKFTDANKNQTNLPQTIEHQLPTSSVRDMPEDEDSDSADSAEQSEILVSFTDGVSTDSYQGKRQDTKVSQEHLIDLHKDIYPEPERSQNPYMEEFNDSLVSLIPDIAASVDDIAASWNVQDKKVEMNPIPDTEEIQSESVLEVESPKTLMDNNNQAPEQGKMDNSSIQPFDESLVTFGNTIESASIQPGIILPPKEQFNVHQLFFSSDSEESSNPTEETEITLIEETSDTQQSTEKPVDIETIGEPFENVKKPAVSEPYSEPPHGPVRRKFGSSRRSKDRKDVENENEETENLLSIVDVQIDVQNEQIKEEENVNVDDIVDAALISSPNEELKPDKMKEMDENTEVSDDVNPSTKQSTSTNSVLSEDQSRLREDDEIQKHRAESSDTENTHTDDINTTPASDAPVSVEDDTAEGSQHPGKETELDSSLRTEGRRLDNDEPMPKEINIMSDGKVESLIEEKSQEKNEKNIVTVESQVEPVQSPQIVTDDEHMAAVQDYVDKILVQVHKEVLEGVEPPVTNDESLKSTEMTMLMEAGESVDDISNVMNSQVPDDVTLKQPSAESSTEPEDKTEVNMERYALKEPINVHQLTFISVSDSETHEEMDNSSLQRTKPPVLEQTMAEQGENVQLINTDINTGDIDTQNAPRRKLGSSRRMKDRKMDVIPAESKDTLSNASKDAFAIPKFVETCPTELKAEPIDQSDVTKAAEISFLDKDQTVDSTQEKVIEDQGVSFEAQTMTDTGVEVEQKEEGTDVAERLPHDVDVDDTSSQSVAGSGETVRANISDAIEPDVSAEDITDQQKGLDIMEDSKASAGLQINSEPKRRKMGSTRRSELNRKQQDEERNAEDDANILVTTTMDMKDNNLSEDAQPLNSDILLNQGEAAIGLDAFKDKHQSEESIERREVTQEVKEKVLQTDADMVENMDKGVMMPALLEIQPSSPGKRRKMGSTRKNLAPKRESPQNDSVTVHLEREEIVSISKDDEKNKENSDLLVHTASEHQPPPDEETPLSQQNNQDKLRSESKETELSHQREAMAEDAAIARRRKMGSHRKPHTDQSIRQERATGGEASLLHPLREQRADLNQISEVNEGDNKALSGDTASNIKLNSKPVSEKVSQQPPLPSTNVRWESNIRISSGFDRSTNKYEVVMIGDSSVGKTSFIQRAQTGRFSPDIPASIGMDSYKWTVAVDGKTTVLHLWDTAGQERFRSMTRQIFHRAQAFLLMYDVTCVQTFAAVSYWANCIKNGAAENVVVLLLGNKSDHSGRKVKREEGEILAEENNFVFMECSAATGENVIEALETVARLLSQKADKSEEPLILRKPEPKNKLGCC